MQNHNDYYKVAHLYDRYVQVDLDFEFFREYAGSCFGPVLELMAGTGRVSKAIFDCCPNLTCVDISRKMLRRLSSESARHLQLHVAQSGGACPIARRKGATLGPVPNSREPGF